MIEGENTSTDFTPAEQAFIQSGGESDLPETIETVTPEADETEAAPVAEKSPEEKKAEKFVPHGAFHEEREKRKARERDLQTEREARIRLEERLAAFEAAQKPAEQPVIPSVDEDPVAYFKHQNDQLAKELGQIKETTQERQQREQISQYQQSVVGAYKSSVAEIQAEAPDFQDAYKYLVTSRIEELKAAGMDPDEAVATANQDEFYLVERALKERRNPAKAIYSMAKARGFQAKPAVNVDEKIDRIAAGQAEGKSLGGASGGGDNATGLESLLNLSDADFLAAVNNGTFKKVAGG